MNKLTCRQQRYFYVILTIAIVLLAINMRAPIIGFGALSHLIQDELGLSTQLLGIFGAIPMIAFGLSSFIAPKIAQKIGIETTLILASVLLALGVLGRGMGGVAVLMAGTVLLSFAISLGNVIIPAAIKKHAHNHTSQITALYSTALSGFAGLSAVILIPLSDVIGWRLALASFGVMAILAAVFWFMIRQHSTQAPPNHSPAPTPSLWRSKMAWAISLFMGLQSFLYYSLASFFPMILMDGGAPATQAGFAVLLLQMMSIPMTILLSWWVKTGKSIRLIAMSASVMNVLGVAGLLIFPSQWLYLWAILLGCGCGIAFTLCLMLFSLKTHNPSQTAALSGMAQAVGYGIAFFGPVMMGALKDFFGNWQMSLGVLLCFMIIKALMAWIASGDDDL